MNPKMNFSRMRSGLAIFALCSWLPCAVVHAVPPVPSQTPLANIDRALSNVVLDLSVEFPTGDQVSYKGAYARATSNADTFYGYFDPFKCYAYHATNLYFYPVAAFTAGHPSDAAADPAVTYQAVICSGTNISGNFLNWASMSNIDQFRKILTGGNRYIPVGGEIATETILERAANDYHGGSYFPVKSATDVDSGTDPAVQKSYRSGTMREKMLVQNGASVTMPACTAGPGITCTNATLSALEMSSPTATCASLTALFDSRNGAAVVPWTCYHVRVKVCDPSVLPLEDNCVAYGANYKPQGLMQAYEQNMRFAAFGFLADDAKSRQGGVLRARMKSVGPTLADPINISIVNTAKEWDATTGVYAANPDSADQAATTGATKSGVINYLNKFGYGASYKGYDPMAELYYESLRYLRKMPPTPLSISGLTAAMSDDFPVINFNTGGLPDPMTSSCQQNFIIAIGDVNNHCDIRVPGGSVPGSSCGGSVPADTPTYGSNPSVDFATWTNAVQAIQTGSIGSGNSPGRSAGWYMGGMAYWAHVSDIRTDRAAQRPTGKKQNVTTFIVDVLENFNGNSGTAAAQQAGTLVTPFYTTAKFGGFDLSLTTPAGSIDPHSNNLSWDKTANLTPDNWYAGNDPISMKTGLTNVFQSIVTATSLGDGAAPATSGVSIATADKVYYASYELSNGGIGALLACGFSAVNCFTAPDWNAADWLDPTKSQPAVPLATATYQTNLTRQIITRSAGAGKIFEYANLTTAEQALLDIDPTTKATDTPTLRGADRVAYLRGDSTKEIKKLIPGGLFRTRATTKLGDIVGSGAVYVGPPNALYSGAKFSGYSAYVVAKANRSRTLYVGANDGMLHAFDAATGKEAFAYIPNYFLQADATTTSARINTLTMPTYQHQFYVDSTPMVGDVKIGGNWKTVLVGSFGAGGRGLFALDVSDPANFASTAGSMTAESNAATISMWEISNSNASYIDMGYTFNQPSLSPQSGQTLQYALIPTATVGVNQWAIIVGNGFGSTSGKAVLYFINPSDGSLISSLEMNAGPDNGLATPFPFDTDRDGVVDTVWAGDLKGNMRRARWNGTAWVASVAFTGVDTQPITVAPAVTPHPNVSGAYAVIFGTGKYFERSDYNTTSQQAVYGLVDKLSATPITISTLVAQTATTTTTSRTMSSNPVNFATADGWYFNMSTTNGERSTVNPLVPADTGLVIVGSFTPASACLPADGYINVMNAYTGGLALDPSGNPILGLVGIGLGNAYLSTLVTDSAHVKLKGPKPGLDLNLTKDYVKGSRYSWREIRN